jgi:hypothetical protein
VSISFLSHPVNEISCNPVGCMDLSLEDTRNAEDLIEKMSRTIHHNSKSTMYEEELSLFWL